MKSKYYNKVFLNLNQAEASLRNVLEIIKKHGEIGDITLETYCDIKDIHEKLAVLREKYIEFY